MEDLIDVLVTGKPIFIKTFTKHSVLSIFGFPNNVILENKIQVNNSSRQKNFYINSRGDGRTCCTVGKDVPFLSVRINI